MKINGQNQGRSHVGTMRTIVPQVFPNAKRDLRGNLSAMRLATTGLLGLIAANVLAPTGASVRASSFQARTHVTTPAITERRGLADFDLDGNGTWAVHGNVLTLEKAGVPGGPIRRPAALAILKSDPFTDLTFKVEMRSTAPVDLDVRDVQLIFGYQSPSEFYYVHLSKITNDVHNGIFLVNKADRERIDNPTVPAKFTDQAWHRVRLERRIADGSARVFFDDEPKPILEATDKTFLWGRVGVGSFDETGEFRAFDLRGTLK